MSFFAYFKDALELMSNDPNARAGLAAIPNAELMFGNQFVDASGTSSGGSAPLAGTVPQYDFARGAVPGTRNPDRRPGSKGQRYFTGSTYVPKGNSTAMQSTANTLAAQAANLRDANTANMIPRPGPVTPPDPTSMSMNTYAGSSDPASGVINSNPVPQQSGFSNFTPQYNMGGGITSAKRYQEGGIIERLAAAGINIPEEDRELAKQVLGHIPDSVINHPTLGKRYIQQLLAKAKERVRASQGTAPPPREGMMDRISGALGEGRSPAGGESFAGGGAASSSYNRRHNNQNRNGYYLGGPTDGMGDGIAATIDGTQEARLSDGEFVVPADVVSHLGNGNSNAGAENLYNMMDKVRQARTGNTQQGTEINPNKFIPSG